jgi:hypothetical protein
MGYGFEIASPPLEGIGGGQIENFDATVSLSIYKKSNLFCSFLHSVNSDSRQMSEL